MVAACAVVVSCCALLFVVSQGSGRPLGYRQEVALVVKPRADVLHATYICTHVCLEVKNIFGILREVSVTLNTMR